MTHLIPLLLFSLMTIVPNHWNYYDCTIAYKGYDKEIEAERIDIGEALLFSQTDHQLKPYMTDRDYTEGYVSLSYADNSYYLVLRISVASSQGKSVYGTIEQKSPLRFTTIKGEHIFIPTFYTGEGEVNGKTGYTDFILVAELGRAIRKVLCKEELSSMGLIWSVGFEEYEIFNVDLIKDQLTCMKKVK